MPWWVPWNVEITAGRLDNLRDFVLNDDVMYKLFPQLVDRAEPGLDILHQLADEYQLR